MQTYKVFTLHPNKLKTLFDIIFTCFYIILIMKGIDIKKKIQDKGFTLREVAEKLGETPQNLNSLLSVQDIKTGVLERIAQSIGISMIDFFTEGNISVDNKQKPLQNSSEVRIPLVHQYAVAGFGNSNFSIQAQDVKEYYVVPKFKYSRVDFMIEIYGDSMTPRYNSGDVIACTILKNKNYIQWNRAHIIATEDQGILCKRIKPSEKEGFITAISDNPDYPPFDIPCNEVTGIALIVGVIRAD